MVTLLGVVKGIYIISRVSDTNYDRNVPLGGGGIATPALGELGGNPK